MNRILRSASSDPGVLTGASEPFRTDINPALLYYRSFLVAPKLSGEQDSLLNREWRGQKLPEEFGLLAGCYNSQFALLRQAAQCTIACDWGIDMSPGPGTLFPHLSHVKSIVKAGKLRVMWNLQENRQNEASNDLFATYALARNVARDGILISALVQFACESINCLTIAENFGRFSAETLRGLMREFETLPPRQTVAGCIPGEKAMFHDWMTRKVLEFVAASPGDDLKVMERIREFVRPFNNTELEQNDFWNQLVRASGGTGKGVLGLLREESRFYERAATLLALPYHEFQMKVNAFREEIVNSTNVFISASLSACISTRTREFRIEIWTAMVRAAVEYRLHGEAGLRTVRDPCGQGPFGFARFVFEGVDRGFLLKSAYERIPPAQMYPELLIFVEKEGPPFHAQGHKAGTAL